MQLMTTHAEPGQSILAPHTKGVKYLGTASAKERGYTLVNAPRSGSLPYIEKPLSANCHHCPREREAGLVYLNVPNTF